MKDKCSSLITIMLTTIVVSVGNRQVSSAMNEASKSILVYLSDCRVRNNTLAHIAGQEPQEDGKDGVLIETKSMAL